MDVGHWCESMRPFNIDERFRFITIFSLTGTNEHGG